MCRGKKIAIIDEAGFSRICSAILEVEGYRIETISRDSAVPAGRLGEVGLIITSYPYGVCFFNEIKSQDIATIILSDHINGELITILEGFSNSYCMIKPLDYRKFRFLVRQVMSGEAKGTKEGFTIV